MTNQQVEIGTPLLTQPTYKVDPCSVITYLSAGGQFVCVEVLRPSQPDGVMSSAVSLPNHTFTGQA